MSKPNTARSRPSSGGSTFGGFSLGVLVAAVGAGLYNHFGLSDQLAPYVAQLNLPQLPFDLKKKPTLSDITPEPVAYVCENAHFTPRIVAYDPIIIHLENFITPLEREYLLNATHDKFERSQVVKKDTGERFEENSRTSASTFLDRDDPVVTCITRRAAAFQGYPALDRIEGLQLVKYLEGQEYQGHYDWGIKTPEEPAERETTFFGFVQAECENCGTRFPRITVDWSKEDPAWCNFVECNETEHVTFKPVAGSVVFWKNLLPDGQGDERTLHAGLPLKSGKKVGLNIWTRDDPPPQAQASPPAPEPTETEEA